MLYGKFQEGVLPSFREIKWFVRTIYCIRLNV